MMNKYILKNRKPVPEPDMLKYMQWYGDVDNRIVARTEVGVCRVSTVFLGLDHSFDGGQPVLFETMVFGGPLDQEMERYHTWEEAEKGHQDMVDRVLHGQINTIETEIDRLRAERDELMDALIPLANASMPDERALISDEDQERAAALVAKLENRTDD